MSRGGICAASSNPFLGSSKPIAVKVLKDLRFAFPTYLLVGSCFRPNDMLTLAGLDLTFALVSSFV
jgi:hypothetical protein